MCDLSNKYLYNLETQVQVTTLLAVLANASSQQHFHFIDSSGSILCLVFHNAKSHQWTLLQHNNIVICVIILLILHQPHWHCCKHPEWHNLFLFKIPNVHSSKDQNKQHIKERKGRMCLWVWTLSVAFVPFRDAHQVFSSDRSSWHYHPPLTLVTCTLF